MEKPVVPVGNQMERAFPLEIFRKKRNTFRGIPLFPFLPEWPENFCSICNNQSVRSKSKVDKWPKERWNVPVESIQINPKFLSSVDRGRSFTSSERFSLELSPRLHEDGRFSRKVSPSIAIFFLWPRLSQCYQNGIFKRNSHLSVPFTCWKKLYRSICRKILTENSM